MPTVHDYLDYAKVKTLFGVSFKDPVSFEPLEAGGASFYVSVADACAIRPSRANYPKVPDNVFVESFKGLWTMPWKADQLNKLARKSVISDQSGAVFTSYAIYDRNGGTLLSTQDSQAATQCIQFVLDIISYQLHIQKILSQDTQKAIYQAENDFATVMSNYIAQLQSQKNNEAIAKETKDDIAFAFGAFNNLLTNPWSGAVTTAYAVYGEKKSASETVWVINVRGTSKGSSVKRIFTTEYAARATLAVIVKAYYNGLMWQGAVAADYTPYDTYYLPRYISFTGTLIPWKAEDLVSKINTESKTLAALLKYDLNALDTVAANTIRATLYETKAKINILFGALSRIYLTNYWTSVSEATLFNLAKAAGQFTKALASSWTSTTDLANRYQDLAVKNIAVVNMLKSYGCRGEADLITAMPPAVASTAALSKIKTITTVVSPSVTTKPKFTTGTSSGSSTPPVLTPQGDELKKVQEMWASLPTDPSAAQAAYMELQAKKPGTSDIFINTNWKVMSSTLRAIVLMSYTSYEVDQVITDHIRTMQTAAIALMVAAKTPNSATGFGLRSKKPDIKALETTFNAAYAALLVLLAAEEAKLKAAQDTSGGTSDSGSGGSDDGGGSSGGGGGGNTDDGGSGGSTGGNPDDGGSGGGTGGNPDDGGSGGGTGGTGGNPDDGGSGGGTGGGGSSGGGSSGGGSSGGGSSGGGLFDPIVPTIVELPFEPTTLPPPETLPKEEKPWYVRNAVPLLGAAAVVGAYFYTQKRKK